MTGLLPDPVPLHPPPGDPEALAGLVAVLTAAALGHAQLADRLATATAPGWWGADAVAAADRVRRVRELAREASDALQRAASRVATHLQRVEEVRGRLAAHRAAQDDDVATAEARLRPVVDPAGLDLPVVTAALDELRRAEAARERAHRALLDEVARDAAATAAVLAGCCAVAGGTGRRGDEARAVLHLVGALPGWGEDELAARGAAAATALRDEFRADRQEELARDAAPLAGQGAFAAALLTGLGREGVAELLRRLGDGALDRDGAVAGVLAAALGAPVPDAAADEVARVRDARYVDAASRLAAPDLIAVGMGVVLAAGRGNRHAGPPPATVAGWGRQVLARERALGLTRLVERAQPLDSERPPPDPLQEVAVRLGGAAETEPAARLLGGADAWSWLLQRPWDDGGAGLAALVERAGADPGRAGEEAVRGGLTALGTGLGDDGDPRHWAVDRGTAAVLAPAMGTAVAAQADVVAGALHGAAGGADQDRDLLRGLGLVTLDRSAAAAVGFALQDGLDRSAGAPGAPSEVRVTAGYLAVREYGQRLAHAIEGFDLQAAARRGEGAWTAVTEVASLAVKRVPVAGDIALGYAQHFLGADGTWEAGPDTGLRFDGGDAARATVGVEELTAAERSRTARAAFGAVGDVVGRPVPPRSPEWHWYDPLVDVVLESRTARMLETGARIGDFVSETIDGE